MDSSHVEGANTPSELQLSVSQVRADEREPNGDVWNRSSEQERAEGERWGVSLANLQAGVEESGYADGENEMETEIKENNENTSVIVIWVPFISVS